MKSAWLELFREPPHKGRLVLWIKNTAVGARQTMQFGAYTQTKGADNQESVSRQNFKKELTNLRIENEALYDQFEQTISRANTLEVRAEIARLEFNQVFNAIDDAIWIIGNNKKVLRVNAALLKILNLKHEDEVLGKQCHELIRSDICLTENCPLNIAHKKLERVELDIEIKNIKGEQVPYWLTITPLLGLVHEPIGIVEQFKDITERKHYEAELMKANSVLERLATLDGLTQLANRRCFDDTMKKEWRRARRENQPLSVILCDVDYFKLYNDHYGHQEGDECLKAVATCLHDSLLRPADFIARYGGEEFVIILPNTDTAGAQKVAENLRKAVLALRREHKLSKVNDYVTLSFGAASAVPEKKGIGFEDLIKSADDCLYTSKQVGRNTVTVKDLDSP